MPASNPGAGPTQYKAKAKPKATPKTVVPRNADTGDKARTKAAPKPVVRPVFKPPATTAPFASQQAQAQTQVRVARRRLPAPVLAQPPIVGTAGARPKAKAAAAEPKMTRVEVATFLKSQSKVAQHAREQIVGSIRAQVGTATGQERVDQITRLMDEIATDPRLSRTRKAIRHYAAIEAATARPQTRDELKAGPKDKKVGVGFATVNLTAAQQAARKVGDTIAPGLKGDGDTKKFGKAALSDLAHLPIMGAQTTYEVGMAAKEAAGGDTKRAKELAKSLLDGVYGHLARGDVNGAVDYFREHPIYAILEVRGGKGIVGRGAGAAMRSGALGDGAKAVASTARKDLSLSGQGARVADRQHYSPDVLTKLLQVALERGRAEKGARLGDHRLRRRGDFESDMAAATSRTVRSDEARQAKDAKPKGPLAEVVGLAVQGVLRKETLKADLEKELARLDHAHATAEFSTGAQKRQNRTTADAIRKVLGSPAAMARIGEVAQSGRANVRAINDLERQGEELGASVPARNERAKLFPPAQAHLGAEYSDAPFRAARGREVAAGRELRAHATELRQKVAEIRETEKRAQELVAALATKHKSERGREAHLGAPVAAYYVGDQRFTLRHEAIDTAKQAGVPLRDIRRVATTASEAKRVGELSGARRAVRAAADRRRAAEAELRALNKRGKEAVPARAAFEKARAERKGAMKGGTNSLNAKGQRLTNDEIRAAVGDDVAYLPHHTQNRGARAYYQTAFAGRKTVDNTKKRTGAAFEKGAVDVSYDAVAEHRIRLRGVINRIAEHDRIIHSIAIKGPGGKMMTWDQAEKIAANAKDQGAKLVPYRAVPGSYDKARIESIASKQEAADMPELSKMINEEFAQRLKEPAPGDRETPNVVLVPAQIVNQLKEQHAVSSSAGAAGNIAADTFRRVVLPFSTKWLTGNVVEAGIRLAAVGAGVNAHRIGRNLLKEIDKLDHDQALRVRAALTGGLLYGNRGLTVRRVAEHFEDTALETPAKAVSLAGQTPGIKQLGQLMKGYTDTVFQFNRMIESNAQIAALGKHAKRDMQEMTNSWWKATRAQEKVLQDLAEGYVKPGTASKNIHDAARYIDQTLGQYSRFSPRMRRIIQQAAPFLPWYLNAARFVFWTLPAKHPIKTGIYALVAQNLQADFDAGHNSLPPGDLRSEIVMDDGTVLPLARFSPFGAFGSTFGGGNEQLTALVDPLFPQFKSAALAAFGLNFSGHAAKIDPKSQDPSERGVPGLVRLAMAVNSLAEAFIPVVGIGKRIREGGSTGYDDSNILSPKVKPGTDVPGGAANRILNPFRPVSGIKGGARGGAAPVATATPSAPAPVVSPEDELLDNLYQNLDDAQGQQALEDELLNNLYGGG